jgi:hypothetical protein
LINLHLGNSIAVLLLAALRLSAGLRAIENEEVRSLLEIDGSIAPSRAREIRFFSRYWLAFRKYPSTAKIHRTTVTPHLHVDASISNHKPRASTARA